MKSMFRLSLLSLAILSACAPTVGAAKTKTPATVTKHTSQSSSYLSKVSSGGYPMTFAGTVPTSNAWQWSPTTPVMPTNYDQFMVWAEDINGGKSNEPLAGCWGDTLCVGGLLDLDFLHYTRKANLLGPAASPVGVGIRPGFGPTPGGYVGSINNANIFFDVKYAGMARIHGNFAYVNGGVKTNAYAEQVNADLNTVYISAPSLKVDELYLVLSSPHSYPLYAKIGRFYLDFGNYQPNGYGLPTITPSLTQLMTQVRTGGAQVGLALENGIYGSATWSIAQQSFLSVERGTNNKNYSARLGMMRQYDNAYFNVNGSFIWDVRDADYIMGNYYVANVVLLSNISPFYGAFGSRRQHAYAVHADGKFYQWGGGIEGMGTTGSLNPDGNGAVWTAGANINYSFPTVGHDSSVDLSYQVARHAAIVQGTGTLVLPPFPGLTVGPISNVLPKNRVQVTYIAKVVNHINLAFQVVRDKDFAPPAGTSLTSNYYVFRIDTEL